MIGGVYLREKADALDRGDEILAQAQLIMLNRRGSLVEIHFHVADSLYTAQRLLDPIAAGVALASIQEAHRSHSKLPSTACERELQFQS